MPTNSIIVTIDTISNSVPANLAVDITGISGASGVCDATEITVTTQDNNSNTGTVQVGYGSEEGIGGVWQFAFSASAIPLAVPDEAECVVTFQIEGWQDTMPRSTAGFRNSAEFTITLVNTRNDNDTDSGDTTDDGNGNGGSEPTEPSTPVVETGDVIINEIAWGGTSLSGLDEWIELHNTTNQAIEIGDWIIENARSNNNSLSLPGNAVIPANGFYLITRQNPNSANSAVSVSLPQSQIAQVGNLSLADNYQDNGALRLTLPNGTVIDRTPEPTSNNWPQGSTGATRASMQRSNVPGDGTDGALHWYTCDRAVLEVDGTLALMESYWKDDYKEDNCGTPGRPNLSSNDPAKMVLIDTNNEAEDTTYSPAYSTSIASNEENGNEEEVPNEASEPEVYRNEEELVTEEEQSTTTEGADSDNTSTDENNDSSPNNPLQRPEDYTYDTNQEDDTETEQEPEPESTPDTVENEPEHTTEDDTASTSNPADISFGDVPDSNNDTE